MLKYLLASICCPIHQVGLSFIFCVWTLERNQWLCLCSIREAIHPAICCVYIADKLHHQAITWSLHHQQKKLFGGCILWCRSFNVNISAHIYRIVSSGYLQFIPNSQCTFENTYWKKWYWNFYQRMFHLSEFKIGPQWPIGVSALA